MTSTSRSSSRPSSTVGLRSARPRRRRCRAAPPTRSTRLAAPPRPARRPPPPAPRRATAGRPARGRRRPGRPEGQQHDRVAADGSRAPAGTRASRSVACGRRSVECGRSPGVSWRHPRSVAGPAASARAAAGGQPGATTRLWTRTGRLAATGPSVLRDTITSCVPSRRSCTWISTPSSPRSSSATSPRCAASRSWSAASAGAAWWRPRPTRPAPSGCTPRCRPPRPAAAAPTPPSSPAGSTPTATPAAR